MLPVGLEATADGGALVTETTEVQRVRLASMGLIVPVAGAASLETTSPEALPTIRCGNLSFLTGRCTAQAGTRARVVFVTSRPAGPPGDLCGDPDTGRTHVKMALARADRRTAIERAMASTVRAAPGHTVGGFS
jgi:hypothetical protein